MRDTGLFFGAEYLEEFAFIYFAGDAGGIRYKFRGLAAAPGPETQGGAETAAPSSERVRESRNEWFFREADK